MKLVIFMIQGKLRDVQKVTIRDCYAVVINDDYIIHAYDDMKDANALYEQLTEILGHEKEQEEEAHRLGLEPEKFLIYSIVKGEDGLPCIALDFVEQRYESSEAKANICWEESLKEIYAESGVLGVAVLLHKYLKLLDNSSISEEIYDMLLTRRLVGIIKVCSQSGDVSDV